MFRLFHQPYAIFDIKEFAEHVRYYFQLPQEYISNDGIENMIKQFISETELAEMIGTDKYKYKKPTVNKSYRIT